MYNQSEVNNWLADYLKKLLASFGDRLVFVGHQGSWARGEAKPESDIDTLVILDTIKPEDLELYQKIISSMPDAELLASGALVSIPELKAWPRFELVQCFYGCKSLHGKIEEIIEKPTTKDLIEDIKVKASANSHHARHYLLYPHDLSRVVHNLKYPFKNCFYALQAWIIIKEGKYIARKNEMIEMLKDSDNREVVRVAKDWKQLEQDREKRPLFYINLLERWSRNMLLLINNYKIVT